MSKHEQPFDERIPSYEESVATVSSPFSTSKQTRSSPHQQRKERLKQERLRKVRNILVDHVEPTIDRNLDNGVDQLSLIILPSDAFPPTTSITASSIVTPPIKEHSEIIRLKGEEYQTSFVQQWVLVQDLSDILLRSMSDPSSMPELQASLPETRSAPLPERPARKRSWINRAFGVPPEDHDPTGSTGKWNLGWRMDEDPSSSQRTISSNELSLSTKLQEVTFRTANEMGLLESKSVRCIWMEIRLKT